MWFATSSYSSSIGPTDVWLWRRWGWEGWCWGRRDKPPHGENTWILNGRTEQVWQTLLSAPSSLSGASSPLWNAESVKCSLSRPNNNKWDVLSSIHFQASANVMGLICQRLWRLQWLQWRRIIHLSFSLWSGKWALTPGQTTIIKWRLPFDS